MASEIRNMEIINVIEIFPIFSLFKKNRFYVLVRFSGESQSLFYLLLILLNIFFIVNEFMHNVVWKMPFYA